MTAEQEANASHSHESYTFFYRLTKWVSEFLFHTFLPVRYHHAERAMDQDAPYILIANHLSLWDPLVVGIRCSRYHIRFLGKKELAKNPFLKSFFAGMRMIAVDRHNMDMAAVRACLKTLKEGHVLGIFPEGTRHKEGIMQNLESGVAMIALRAGVPLLPAYISDKPRFLRRAHCYYGRPIILSDIAGAGKESCDEVLDRITKAFAELVAEHGQTLRKK